MRAEGGGSTAHGRRAEGGWQREEGAREVHFCVNSSGPTGEKPFLQPLCVIAHGEETIF